MTLSHSKIGIDVGAKGCLCHLTKKEIIKIIRFNKEGLKGYIRYLKSLEYPVDICIEQVHSMPRQGVKSMFSFGTRYGEIKGMLDTLELPYLEVPSNYWQKKLIQSLGVTMTENDTSKSVVADIACSIYPNQKNLFYSKLMKVSYDITDSVGIALYLLDVDKYN